MIIEKLLLHDFGVYEGRHEISLTPEAPSRPVVLFGGLNGRGKTTLMNAVQLALYGKRASMNREDAGAYGEILSRSVHQGQRRATDAAVGLEFRMTRAGVEHSYRITRTWRAAGKATKENLTVSIDGKADALLSQNWDEHVESILPAKLAPLFFFDGEKIEGLAKQDSAADILSTAINALLGLDLVDQLQKDLMVLERRRRNSVATETEREQASDLEAELKRISERRAELARERNPLLRQLEAARRSHQNIDAEFKSQGGTAYERQREIERRSEVAQEQLSDAAHALREAAHGTLPLLLVKDLLADALENAKAANDTVLGANLVDLLVARDQLLLDELARNDASEALCKSLNSFLEHDRETRTASNAKTRGAVLEPGDFDQLSRAEVSCSDAKGDVRALLDQYQLAMKAVDEAEREIASIPSQQSIFPIEEQRTSAIRAVGAAEEALRRHDAEVDALERAGERTRRKYAEHLESVARSQLEAVDIRRRIRHSERARTTLTDFRSRVLSLHLQRLERFILEAFKQLLSKQRLISNVQIDAKTFGITLTSSEGRTVLPTELSAGERQLLAVAILWGLGRAAGNHLPVIIDTPMGRLDSVHRAFLVERYFPNAARQVILLSTDEEVDEKFSTLLDPAISHRYELLYDDASQSTAVSKGYFWEAA